MRSKILKANAKKAKKARKAINKETQRFLRRNLRPSIKKPHKLSSMRCTPTACIKDHVMWAKHKKRNFYKQLAISNTDQVLIISDKDSTYLSNGRSVSSTKYMATRRVQCASCATIKTFRNESLVPNSHKPTCANCEVKSHPLRDCTINPEEEKSMQNENYILNEKNDSGSKLIFSLIDTSERCTSNTSEEESSKKIEEIESACGIVQRHHNTVPHKFLSNAALLFMSKQDQDVVFSALQHGIEYYAQYYEKTGITYIREVISKNYVMQNDCCLVMYEGGYLKMESTI